jgi:signal transduction histidine kinase/CheY-like chemotaxis protein
VSAEQSFASGFPQLHSLTQTALLEQKLKDPDNSEISLALIRKTGQIDQAKAIVDLELFVPLGLAPEYRLYYEALACEIHIRAGDMDKASPHCEKTRMMVEKGVDDPVVEAVGHNAIGFYVVSQGKPELALDNFEQALKKVSGSDDKALRVQLLHNRGVALMLYGLTDLALEAFGAADDEKAALADDDQLPRILAYNLGYLQAQRGEHIEALASYAIVVPWLEATEQTARAYIGHVQVALSLSALERHQESLDELLRWTTRSDITVPPDSEAQAYLAIGTAQLGLGNEAEGLDSLLHGIAIARNADNPSRLRELSLVYCRVLIDRGDYLIAIEYLNSLISRLQISGVVEGRGHTHRLLAKAYAGLNDFSSAYEHSLAAHEAERVAQSDETIRRLTSLRVSNELDVKEQQLALSIEREAAAKASQSLMDLTQWAVIVGLLAALVLLYLLLSQRNNRKEAKYQRETAKRLKKEVELRTADIAQELEKRHNLEQTKAALELRLLKDDKLRSIGQLTGGVAHDFNNLMTIILLSAELLTPEMDQEQQKLVGDIIAATESGKAITRGLLAYARQQTLRPAVLDFNEYLNAHRTLFQRSLDESLQFSINSTLELSGGAIEVDEGQLTSCILNLIFNAREASQKNGQISLSVIDRGDRIAIEVGDTGRGMTAKEVEMATEPFYSTKTVSEGSGLGLSMVYGFMKQSGGDMLIESEPSIGTTVVLLFDKVMGELNETPKPAARKSTKIEPTGIRILLVEDEPQIRNIGRTALQRAGHQVLVAEDGDAALKLMCESDRIDMLISDLIMPGSISGEKLLVWARERYPGIPILLISGYAENIPEGYKFLAKPFSLTDLREAVQSLLLENNGMNKNS